MNTESEYYQKKEKQEVWSVHCDNSQGKMHQVRSRVVRQGQGQWAFKRKPVGGKWDS